MRQLQRAASLGRGGRCVALTFDDGYVDYLDNALPVLQAHKMTSTVYVVAGRLGGDNAWDAAGPRLPLMDAAQIRKVVEAGHEVGSHSLNHVRLTGLNPAELMVEVQRSREVLQEVLGSAVDGFCYPYGSHDRASEDAVRDAGYSYACATDDYTAPGIFRLPRFYVGQRDGAFRLTIKLTRHWVRGVRRGARR